MIHIFSMPKISSLLFLVHIHYSELFHQRQFRPWSPFDRIKNYFVYSQSLMDQKHLQIEPLSMKSNEADRIITIFQRSHEKICSNFCVRFKFLNYSLFEIYSTQCSGFCKNVICLN